MVASKLYKPDGTRGDETESRVDHVRFLLPSSLTFPSSFPHLSLAHHPDQRVPKEDRVDPGRTWQALQDLEANSDIKAQLRELYFVTAKEIEVGG